MATDENPKDVAAADKAYQAAAEAVPVKSDAPAKTKPVDVKSADAKDEAMKPTPAAAPKEPAQASTGETAAKAKAEAKPAATDAKAPLKPKAPAKAKIAAKVKTAAKPKVVAAKSKPVAAKGKSAAGSAKSAVPAKIAAPKSLAPKLPAPKPAAAKPTATVVQASAKKPTTSDTRLTSAAAKPDKADTAPVFAGLFANFLFEEPTMDMSPNFASLQEAMAEAQAKAKAAFEKGTSMLGEATEFAKGNVEAAVTSGKILADGMQSIGSEIASEGRSAFETMSDEIKELAAAKSPTEFFKIQGEMMRKNFDSAVAYSSKNSESMLKLMSDAMAPISGRVSMAMEKVRKPAASA